MNLIALRASQSGAAWQAAVAGQVDLDAGLNRTPRRGADEKQGTHFCLPGRQNFPGLGREDASEELDPGYWTSSGLSFSTLRITNVRYGSLADIEMKS
jgi:hypothetical protein